MARRLYANYFTWTREDNAFLVREGAPLSNFTLFFQQAVGTADLETQGSLLGTSGKFVGMIFYVPTNTNDNDTISIGVHKLEPPYSAWVEITHIDVPPGEVGCFYTDPDLLESTRVFDEYSYLKVTTEASGPTPGTKGIFRCTCMIGFDMDAGTKIGD